MEKLEAQIIPQDGENPKELNIVNFEGPDDVENPFNWPTKKKARQLILMSFNTFITGVAPSTLAMKPLVKASLISTVHWPRQCLYRELAIS